MNEAIRQLKSEYLKNLEAKKADIEKTKSAVVSVKYSNKKVKTEQISKELDETLSKFVQEEQAKLNDKVSKMKAKIAQKKADLEASAMAEAQSEADYEMASQIADYDKEISALKKELGTEE